MKRQTNRWLVVVCAAVAVSAFATSAQACRAVRSLTEAEVRERTALFTAIVEGVDRTAESDGERIRAVLRTERTVYGEPAAAVVADDYLGSDEEVVVYCGGRNWIGDELAGLSVGDEVVVLGWRQTSGVMTVNDLGRMGGVRARLLLNGPRP